MASLKKCLDEYISYIRLQNPLSDNTISAYTSDIEDYVNYLIEKNKITEIEDVNESIIENYLKELLESVKQSSLARKMTSIRNFHSYISDLHDLKNPCLNIKVKINNDHLPTYLTENELKQIMDSYNDDNLKDLLEHAILELLYSSGLRVSELCELTMRQVYLDERIVRVRGKGDKERLVPFGQNFKEILLRYLNEARPIFLKNNKSDKIFIKSDGKVVTRQFIWTFIKNKCIQLGIKKDISPHTFRHTFATEILNNGGDLRSVQELLGHSDISTTQIYTHIQSERLHSDYDKYFPKRGKKG